MAFASPSAHPSSVDVTRPMVKALFVASCLLSIVSWYTTQEGMVLFSSSDNPLHSHAAHPFQPANLTPLSLFRHNLI